MKIKFFATSYINSRVKKYSFEVNEEDKLSVIGDKLGDITFSKYYNNIDLNQLMNRIPFILRENGKIEWEISIDNVTIKEFINTHKININDGIYLEYRYVQAGGPGFLLSVSVWKKIYQVVEVVSTISGIVQFGVWIKSIFKHKVPYPQSVLCFIYKENKWNHYVLAEKLDINKEDAKKILKIFGYTWDNSKKIYYIDNKTKKKMIKKIDNINVYSNVKT